MPINPQPGINVWAAHDTHTFGCMFVDVQAGDGEDERFILAGDNVYAYENITGRQDRRSLGGL